MLFMVNDLHIWYLSAVYIIITKTGKGTYKINKKEEHGLLCWLTHHLRDCNERATGLDCQEIPEYTFSDGYCLKLFLAWPYIWCINGWQHLLSARKIPMWFVDGCQKPSRGSEHLPVWAPYISHQNVNHLTARGFRMSKRAHVHQLFNCSPNFHQNEAESRRISWDVSAGHGKHFQKERNRKWLWASNHYALHCLWYNCAEPLHYMSDNIREKKWP